MTATDVRSAPEPLAEEAGFDPSTAARVLLATLSAAAGAVHLAMVPSHMAEWAVEGLAFAVAGWVQLGVAVLVVTRPTRLVLRAAIVVNLVFVAVWALSRTAGFPVGPHAGHPEAATAIDLVTVGLEAALILAAGVVLARPGLGRRWSSATLVAASIVPVALVALTTAVLASPSARNHSHDAHGDHDEVTAAGDPHDHAAPAPTGAAPAATGDGHDHGSTGATAGDGHDHDHGPAAATVNADDRCDWDLNTVAYWSQNPPTADDGTHHHGHGAGNGQGNEHGVQPWAPLTDKAQCDQLRSQIAEMKKVAESLPTAQDAVNAGCFQVVIYVEGIASHYICPARLRDGLVLDQPEMILYGGSQPWAPIVGLSYMVYQDAPPNQDASAPLWVRYMTWHYHEGLCIRGGQVIGGDDSDAAKCAASGGRKMGRTGYMGHYWLPQCNSPDGVFSASNPRLDIAVANVNDDPANKGKDLVTNPCAGSQLKPTDDRFGRPEAPTEQAAAAPR